MNAYGSGLKRVSPLDEVFDVVVVGSGYAGFAAAMVAQLTFPRVLLVGVRGDLLWESGRGMYPCLGVGEHPVWEALTSEVDQRGGRVANWMDGALAEVVGTTQLRAAGVSVFYYARPVAVQRQDGRVVALLLATKSGVHRLAGQRWVDATEGGDLARLIDPDGRQRTPTGAEVTLYLQHPDWPGLGPVPGLCPTAWPTERMLSVEVAYDDPRWRTQILTALAGLETTVGAALSNMSVSHLSFEPVPYYRGTAGAPPPLSASNVVAASPSLSMRQVCTLADRFGLGVEAARQVAGLPSGPRPGDPEPGVHPQPHRTISADVCVVGGGTGGALAALAAARTGCRVVCLDLATYLGGVGTGGGIHTYSFGVPGGLQAEVDRRTRELMSCFRGGPLGDGPFNPWAKMITLETLLRGDGVEVHQGTVVFDVETNDSRVVAVLAAGPHGVTRVEAESFVDGTGDGDLCALAGAEFTLGRRHDGLTHAYSQSSGGLRELHGRPRMRVVNFDAGFCDPTDPVDLTRARLVGISQYLLPRYTNLSRPTYIAPALGLRQGRQVRTEYVLSLDDQISGRRFDDVIGFTASHYENHASDCEFESDEALFWVWANRQWTTPIGCELSYRMLVPRGLRNVWIASRCLGVSQDAHHATRMQRDIQRAGEAAGAAAAISAKHRADGGQVPYEELRRRLNTSGALTRKRRRVDISFGRIGNKDAHLAALPIQQARVAALADLDAGRPGEAMWWLFRHRGVVRDEVVQRLQPLEGRSPMVTWLAAGVVAMWHDTAAEERLMQAIATREYGYGPGFDWEPSGYNVPRRSRTDPFNWAYVVPNWLCALALLRCCGTEICLQVIEDLIDGSAQGLNTLTTTALTLAELVTTGALPQTTHPRVARLLSVLASSPIVGAVDNPRRRVGRHSEVAVRRLQAWKNRPPASPSDSSGPRQNAVENSAWQVPFAINRAREALGLPPLHSALAWQDDDRKLVRHAFRPRSPSDRRGQPS